jgi:hypothetical protein
MPLVPPKKGASAELWKAFLDQFCDHKSPARLEKLEEWALSKAMWESEHWVKRLPQGQAGRMPRFASLKDDTIPMPVTNRIIELLDNEVAKLDKKKSKGKVRSKIKRQGEQGAAKAGDEIFEHHQKEQKWPRTRRKAIFRYVHTGTMFLHSLWETNYLDTIRVGIDNACKCLNCGCMYAGREVKPEAAIGLPPEKRTLLARSDQFNPEDATMKTTFDLQGCLECGAPLRDKYTPTPEEALGQDPFGADLGEDVPKGDAILESLHPSEVYVENEGIGVEPENINQVAVEQIKSLDWIRSHFKHPELDKLKPEDPVMLAERAFVSGQYSQDQTSSSADSRNLYRNHARVRRFYQRPLSKTDMGRYVIMTGPLLITDSELCFWRVDGKGGKHKGERAKIVTPARFWIREGEVYGMPAINPLVSPQRRINMIGSQIVDRRERHVEMVMSTPGMKLRAGGNIAGLTGSRLIYDWDAEAGTPPTLVETKLIDQGVYTELEWLERFMREALGAHDADEGKTAPSGTPAIMYKLQAEQAAIRRGPREEELKDSFEEAYSHQMVLLQHFAREPREYWVMGAGQQWEEKSWEGADLIDQTDIDIEEEASYDEDVYQKEIVIQADTMMLIDKTDPVTIHEVSKVLGLPTSITERRSIQIEDAARKWAKFQKEQKVPSVEPTQDDHATKFAFYGKALMGDDGLALKEAARWEEILPLIAGWDGPTGKLAQAEQMDAQVRQWQSAASAPPPQAPQLTGDPLQDTQTQGQYAQQAQGIQLAQQGLAAIPGGVESALLPEAVNERVLTVWLRILTAKGYTPTPEQIPFLKFEAVVEAHRLLQERQAQAAMAGQAQAAAPGQQPQPAMA